MAPNFGHEEWEVELKLDITSRPEKGCRSWRRRIMGKRRKRVGNGTARPRGWLELHSCNADLANLWPGAHVDYPWVPL